MKAEELFIKTALSYKRLLSTVSEAPSLRDYCRSRHVSYPDFVRWGTVSEIASGIMEIEHSKKRLQKEVDVAAEGKSLSVPLNTSEAAPAKPLLYPLRIVCESCTPGNESVGISSRLCGISISFPNGVKVSVKEADSQGIYSLVHGHSL